MDINKYEKIPPVDTPLLWPTLEGEIPMTSPLKGRPDIHTQSNTQVTQMGNTELT